MSGPICPTCATPTRLTNGAEIYPRHPHLADKPIYTCDGCGARVGCHPGTTTPLGTPADHATRIARITLHEKRLDPLWKNACREPAYADTQAHPNSGRRANGKRARQARAGIIRAARRRVYAWLADRMNLTADECHTGLFDIERCRQAWRVLTGVTYGEIREWARERESAERDSEKPAEAVAA